MSGWLLDTSILSAFAPGGRALAPRQARWFERRSDQLYLSAVTAAEIEAGVRKLERARADRRARGLRAWFGRILELYGERVLPFDVKAAQACGALTDAARAAGRDPGFADAAIAATAQAHGLTVLTANLRHFAELDVEASNPFGEEIQP